MLTGTLATAVSLRSRSRGGRELKSRGGGEGEGGEVRSKEGPTYLAENCTVALMSDGMKIVEVRRETGGGMAWLAGSHRHHPPLWCHGDHGGREGVRTGGAVVS
jgi:hypothetical protein